MASYQTLHTIQAVGGTVGGTAESARGNEIKLDNADYLTLFVDYVAGTEGTVHLYPKFRHSSGGTDYPWQEWTNTSGTVVPTDARLKLTASDSAYYTFDVRGQEFVQFYTITTGAPTGALGLFAIEKGTL